MRRVVFKDTLTRGMEITLDQAQIHYLYDVLRMREGDDFIGVDQGGNPFVVRLGPQTLGACSVLNPAEESSREPGLSVTLFVPLLKGDKLELVVQKSVELGVSEIVFFEARRSVVKWTAVNLDKKIARMQKIASEATQQCRRHMVPSVRGVLNLEDVGAAAPGVFAWEEEHNISLREHLHISPPSRRLALLFGPEGGLTKTEADIFTASGWTSVSLGTRILRAETAAITLLACTMFACGEMG